MIRTGALLLTLATPAFAQETLTSQALLEILKTKCQAIAADPEAALSAAFGGDGADSGAITPDKAIIRFQEVLTLPDARFGSLFFIRTQLPGGSRSSCAVNVNFEAAETPIALPDLADLVAAEAEALLGAPVTRHGGDVLQSGEVGRLLLWTTGDAPEDPSISLTQSKNFVNISIDLATVAN
jgi:hypothetical protein